MEKLPIAITATLVEPQLLQSVIVQLASRRFDAGYSRERVQLGWKAIDTSTVEAYVSGDVNISWEDQLVQLPFASSFLFTCIKCRGTQYSLALSQSLS